MAGLSIVQRLFAGKGLPPVEGGHFVWARDSDGHEFIGSFDELEALLESLMQQNGTAALPLGLTDTLYVVQSTNMLKCQVQDVLNVLPTTTPFTNQNLTAVLAHSRGTILESTNNAFAQHIILPEDTGDPTQDFGLNASIEAVQVSATQLDFVAENSGTMTFLAPSGTKARVQGSTIFARRRAPNTWHITGDTTV